VNPEGDDATTANVHRETAKPRTLRSLAGEAWRHFSAVVIAILCALLIRALVVETFYVPSESMLPTLVVGDHMLVEKFTFGARIPFTELRFPALREPRRGEVVTFVLGREEYGEICPIDHCPDYPRERFVKRIVGLPGDTIEVLADRVYLNGQLVHVERSKERFVDDSGDALHVGVELLDESPHAVLDHPGRRGMNQVRFTVPEGRYYMMGDNRDHSNDSRGWGTVRGAEIIGPVTFLYWSWNNRGTWRSMLNPLTWWRLLTRETRWERIGMSIQ
jgi:signal peptidase I